MNTEDISLSSSSKMAPWPEHHQEPVAPDKNDENRVGTTDNNPEAGTINQQNSIPNVNPDNNDIHNNFTGQNLPGNSTSENKQEEPATLSTLNEGELRALLDEAITYKCPKDREGKSNLFKELLQEAEADETEEGRRAVTNSRCLPGSNRRRHKRDSVSERLTHGGSLQNLAQPISSEFDSSFTYSSSGCNHIYGGGRRKGKKHTGPSVSARQREGGSLPSNVNASHSLASLANLDLLFDKKGFSDERAAYDWANKEKSKSLDKPSYSGLKREEKDKEKKEKEGKRENDSFQTTDYADKDKRGGPSSRGKQQQQQLTNEMVESDPPPPEPKPDYMVIDITDVEVGGIADHNVAGVGGGGGASQRVNTVEGDDEEGTEMKVIEPRMPVQFITHATFDIAQTPVDTSIEFPIREHNLNGKQQDKLTKVVSINGTETTTTTTINAAAASAAAARQFQTYNTVKCIVGGTSAGGNSSSSSSSAAAAAAAAPSNQQQGKLPVSNVYSMMPVNWTSNSPNLAMETVSRLASHHVPVKESSGSGEKKSLDENGNAVQGYSKRKKTSRKQEPNVIVYNAENVEGHRNEMDIESLINFIESKESKGKKGKTTTSSNNAAVRVGKTSSSSSSGTAAKTTRTTREKDSKREQITNNKLHKSNSLEEISKTKLEDLTAEKSGSNTNSSSGASSVSSQHGTSNVVALRRAKQRSTGDTTVDCRGDRRSWGTEEGQSIYCNDTGDDYTTRRNSNKKINTESNEANVEPDFLVVTKKKKSKKQRRRSSSGGRARNLNNSGNCYLQRSRGFNNDYRTPLSPELRRKSASSMPPSDKSDSSDLDSVHSLPVTSNTNKHNLTKNSSSSDGTPQASYADIARTATINISTNSVLKMTEIVPMMLNASCWPSVPSKTPSESDKIPQDYYPSLDELQNSDSRKMRQHNFAHSNNVNSLSLSFEKPPSPTLNLSSNKIVVVKSSSSNSSSQDNKKFVEISNRQEEEAIDKNIQVFKYVRDIEKMHQRLARENNNKIMNLNNSNTNSNDVITTTQMKSSNNYYSSASEMENYHNSQDNNSNIKDNTNFNLRLNIPRPRPRAAGVYQQQNIQNTQSEDTKETRKTIAGNQQQEESNKKSGNVQNSVSQSEDKVSRRPGNPQSGQLDESENQKTRTQNNPKASAPGASDTDTVKAKSERNVTRLAAAKDQQQQINSKYDDNILGKGNSGNLRTNCENNNEEAGNPVKKSKQTTTTKSLKDQSHKSNSDNNQTISNKKNSSSSRPAVILLDETSSDIFRNSESPSELTFGFEINEQLLLSDDSQQDNQTTTASSSVFTSNTTNTTPIFVKPPPNFDRPPPIFEKHLRYDKPPPNFHIHHQATTTQSQSQQQQQHPHHIHHHTTTMHHVMVPSLPFLSYGPPRFIPPPTYLPPPTPQQPGIIDKYHNQQPKEDFSARFIAPEESINVQNYNHDKIVTFVGLAWEDVMREMPVTASNGRVQYYSGQ